MTLLSLALSLLIAAQQPNVPQSLQSEAISVAVEAINEYQESSVSTSTPITVSPSQSISTSTTPQEVTQIESQAAPVFGSIENVQATSTPTPSCVPNPMWTFSPGTAWDAGWMLTYQTGCPIPATENASWKVVDQNGNGAGIGERGTIGTVEFGKNADTVQNVQEVMFHPYSGGETYASTHATALYIDATVGSDSTTTEVQLP